MLEDASCLRQETELEPKTWFSRFMHIMFPNQNVKTQTGPTGSSWEHCFEQSSVPSTSLTTAQLSKTHFHSLFLHGQSHYDLGMGSQACKCREAYWLWLEVKVSVKTWSSHILESSLLLIDRCLKNTLLFCFHSSEENRFPRILFAENDTLLGNLAWRLLLSKNFPSLVLQ